MQEHVVLAWVVETGWIIKAAFEAAKGKVRLASARSTHLMPAAIATTLWLMLARLSWPSLARRPLRGQAVADLLP